MSTVAVRPCPMELLGWFPDRIDSIEHGEQVVVSREPTLRIDDVWLNGELIFDRSVAIESGSPIRVVSGSEVDVDRQAMVVGTRYPFWLGDIYLIALKKDDGTIEFFSTE